MVDSGVGQPLFLRRSSLLINVCGADESMNEYPFPPDVELIHFHFFHDRFLLNVAGLGYDF